MKLLFVLAHNRFTGANTWAYTLAKEFIANGFDVTFKIILIDNYSYLDGYMGYVEYCQSAGITVHQPLEEARFSEFDFVFLGYRPHVDLVRSNNIIFTVHGPAQDIYDISDVSIPMIRVGVSQRICDKYGIDNLILNGIDLELFKPGLLTLNIPIRALWHSRYPNHISSDAEVCLATMGVKYEIVGNDVDQFEIVNQIRRHDFTIGVGRSAYEAMACGKPVFIGTGKLHIGWVTEEIFSDYIYYNLAHGPVRLPDYAAICDELQNFDANQGHTNRKLAEKYLSSVEMCNKYMSLMIGHRNIRGDDTERT